MKIPTKILLFAIAIIIFQSCTRTLYTPNMQNAPLIKEKNEIRSNIGKNDFQFAYGITNGLGVMVNAHAATGENSYEVNNIVKNDDKAKRRLYEFGLGYFRPIEEHGVFEVYGGAGLGNIAFDSPGQSGRGIYTSKFSRYFVQPSIGVTLEHIDASFSLRFTHLNFYDSEASQAVDEKIKNLDQHSYSFVEPAITLRLGTKYAKIAIQAQTVAQINSSSIKYEELVVNLGVHFNIAKRFQDKSSGIRVID